MQFNYCLYDIFPNLQGPGGRPGFGRGGGGYGAGPTSSSILP